MHVFSLSNRFYYREMEEHVETYIKKDLEIYSSMLRTSFKMVYDKSVKGSKLPILNGKERSLQSVIKERYGTSDYLPLSAINEAKGAFMARKQKNEFDKKNFANIIKRIEKKIDITQKELERYLEEKKNLISNCKNHYYTEKDYLYEVQVVDPKIRQLKSMIGQLTFKKNRFQEKIDSINKTIPSIYFRKRNRMLIPGRRQGKYSNNLFKLDTSTNNILIRTTSGNIILPIQFHKYKEQLYRKIELPHNTPGKAVAYELTDHGEYFIIKAIFEIEAPEIISYPINGSIGIDTNIDHFALTEVDHYGNIVGTKLLRYRNEGSSRHQRDNDIYACAKEIVEYCMKRNKPLVIESLDFEYKLSQMRYSNKKMNRKLSSFAYSEIKEKLERKAILNGIEVIEVNPAYTSKKGKEKYSRLKGMSVHMAASYVIARRGLKYKD